MRKATVITGSILIFLALCCTAIAGSSLSGTKGLLEILSADNSGAGTVSLSLHLGGFSQDRQQWYPKKHAPGDTGWAFDAFYGGKFAYGVGYTFTDYLSVNGQGLVMADAIETDNRSDRPDTVTSAEMRYWAGVENRSSIGMGDTKFGLKFTPTQLIEELSTSPAKALQYFDIALYPMVSIDWETEEWDSTLERASNFGKESQRNKGGIFRYFTSGGVDYSGLGLLTLRTMTEVPFRLYLNGGYVKHTKVSGDPAADEWVYGVGAEVAFAYFQPFVEFTGSARRDTIFGPDLYYIAPALRFGTPFGLNIDLGMAFRLSEQNELQFPSAPSRAYGVTTGWGATPPWHATFGLSYAYDFTKPPPAPPKGVIAGKVYDEETGDPIGATIGFPNSEIPSISSDPATGEYSITLAPGDVRMHVEKEGYLWKKTAVILKKDARVLKDFALKRKVVVQGYVTGKVTDKSTDGPLGATITFPEAKLEPVSTDLGTGVYKATLPPGTHLARIEAEGYITQTIPIVVNKDETTLQNFSLLKKGAKITLRGINFDTGKATIKPESYPVLDEAVQLLKENPAVRVEIQGHTDSVGSDSYNQRLSEARAQSVVNYLTQKGILPSRLTAKGYGESMPVAPNTTRDGRAKNRRIDFLILGE